MERQCRAWLGRNILAAAAGAGRGEGGGGRARRRGTATTHPGTRERFLHGGPAVITPSPLRSRHRIAAILYPGGAHWRLSLPADGSNERGLLVDGVSAGHVGGEGRRGQATWSAEEVIVLVVAHRHLLGESFSVRLFFFENFSTKKKQLLIGCKYGFQRKQIQRR